MEGVIGYVTAFAGNFAPKNWAFCAGQLMPISQNTALFSILGTTYGGNGTSTFALPDLRSKSAIGAGQGPGLTPRSLGEQAGAETNLMTSATMPAHLHTAAMQLIPNANSSTDATTPGNDVYATPAAGEPFYSGSASTNMQSYPGTLNTGPNSSSAQPFSTLHPVLALNYVICLRGVFPARN